MHPPVGNLHRGILHDADTGKAVAIYEFTMLTMQASGNGTEVDFTGESVLTKLTGAPGILFAEDEGSFTPHATGPSPFVTRVHVVGGTGSYQDATGTITATGELTPPAGRPPAPTPARSATDPTASRTLRYLAIPAATPPWGNGILEGGRALDARVRSDCSEPFRLGPGLCWVGAIRSVRRNAT